MYEWQGITVLSESSGEVFFFLHRSSFHSVMFLALSKRLLTAALFALAGWWELKCKYLSMCVCFLKTVTLRVPSSLRVRLVSRKGKEPSFSSSVVNLIAGHTSLRWRSKGSTASLCIMQHVSLLFLYSHCNHCN